MIITLKGADFSASNIGTLSSWRITRSLGTGATYEGVTSVDKGAAFSATVTLAEGYEIGAAGVTITMGGVVLSDAHSVADNVITITIASVTGNVVIKVPTVNTAGGDEPDVPVDPEEPETINAVVNLTLANVDGNILYNTGTGGSTYNATIKTPKSGDSYSSDSSGLTLVNHAYADVAYGFKASNPFTIAVRGSLELNTNTYQRLMRTDKDAPSVFYSYTAGNGMGAKLAGVTENGMTIHAANFTDNTAGSPLNTVYIKPDHFDATETHTYAWTNDGTTIKYYVDGVLAASQNANKLTAATKIGIGDNDESKTYYAAKTHVEMFRIYDYAMTAEEIAALA